MKRSFYLLPLVAVVVCSMGSCKKGGSAPKEPAAEEFVAQTDSDFFMLHDEQLPMSVDLRQDISHLGYQNLRLLRSYVYATHGHWFMEGDLNKFFNTHCDWYWEHCDTTWSSYDNNGNEIMAKMERVDAYYNALLEDYPRAYDMIQLTDEERDFVARIDARMEELRRHPYVKGEEGAKLLNPNLVVNMHQVFDPDPRLMEMLALSNVAFEPTQYQQLFNVYENNQYYGMPSFVTTDVILQAYHMYFSYVLKSLESQAFGHALQEAMADLLLQSVQRLECCADQQMETDRELAAFFAVGLKLLDADPYALMSGRGYDLKSMLGRLNEVVHQEVALVMKEEDDFSPLFKTESYFNYSLFKPRGHYTRSTDQQHYFRAMMWLQKGCYFRENDQQLLQAIRMAQLINDTPTAKKKLQSVDRMLCYLMGKPDNVSLLALADHLAPMGSVDILSASDSRCQQIDRWLQEQFKHCNRIGPKEKIGNQDQMNLMPQRYMLDSEVLGTMYDPAPKAKRAYPSGLDVMDVLGIKTASELVADLNSQQPWADYAKNRQAMQKRLKDYAQEADRTMYDEWLHSLVTLQKTDKQQPLFMRTRTWRLKGLNTALASWALLKHDAVLYGEQPMAAECGGAGLPEPKTPGYVEPNLAFWQELKQMVAHSRQLVEATFPSEDLVEKSQSLEDMVDLCIRCTENELKGLPLDNDDFWQVEYIGSHLEWFTLSVVDPDQTFNNWDDLQGADRCVAQVADVFTRNINGCPKDGILYEATGMANAMYVIVEQGGQYYLTRGGTYSYYEFVRPLGDRLTDEQWQQMIRKGKAPAVPEWFAPLLLGKPVDVDQRFVYSTGC